jgi:hypothetical protein
MDMGEEVEYNGAHWRKVGKNPSFTGYFRSP